MDAKRGDVSAEDVGRALLAWYDANARVLPWRSRPGETADPYRVWLSEVMLQQTTVAAVRPRFEAWVARWPTVAALAAADEADVMAAWAGLGYYARARNLLKAARAVAERGSFPEDEAGLRALPGLGAYTAAAVAAIAFGQSAVVVDANVERVVARLFAILDKGAAIRAAADTITPDARAGDFAQAMMDLGATICTPRAPRCLLCPLRDACAGYASGAPEAFPARKAKAEKPQRYGTIFWLERDTPSSSTPVRAQRAPPPPLTVRADLPPSPPVCAELVEALPFSSRAGQKKGSTSTSSVRTEEGSSGQTEDRGPVRAGRREVLLVRRPARGLLGGMRALPTGPWSDAPPGLADPPATAEWRLLDATVTHVFTHFRLQLALAVGTAPSQGAGDLEGEWWPVDRLEDAGLPTVFAKAAEAIRRSR